MIDYLSMVSLSIETFVDSHLLTRATGFIIKHDEFYFLITNWHIVTGLNTQTLKPISDTAGIPNKIAITFHKKGKPGYASKCTYNLFFNGKPIWIEHKRKNEVDVVAIPLKNKELAELVKFYHLDLKLSEIDMVPECAMPISIIGFPKGLKTTYILPIWKTGHIASDHDLDYDDRPCFLIDATTRSGMSGSPVVLRLTGGYKNKTGSTIYSSQLQTRFLGIYSGRIHKNSEIGRVYRPRVINEILDQ
jgi:hypothetical protein